MSTLLRLPMVRLYGIVILGLGSLVLDACSTGKSSQSTADQTQMDSRNFQFTPDFMQPVGGRQRNITGNYFIRVQPNKIEVDLPYIGRATNVTPGSLDQGMKWVSTDFTYQSEPGKKGRMDISIEPKDVSDVQSIRITRFDNQSGSVQINSVSRSAITYTGSFKSMPKQ